MVAELLVVVPDPDEPTLWRYGRPDASGEMSPFGRLRFLDGAVEEVDDPGWPTSRDMVTAMCLLARSAGKREPIIYDVTWQPIPPIPQRTPQSTQPHSSADRHPKGAEPTLAERLGKRPPPEA